MIGTPNYYSARIVWQNDMLETRSVRSPLTPVAPESIRAARAGPHLACFRSPVSNLENTTLVAVKIKLKRLGKIRNPQYRIIVADARTKRDGRAIEEIGRYNPKENPSFIEVDSERAQYWLGVGAQPTEPVRSILKVTGDWQKFKGLPGAEGRLKMAEPKADKKAVFDAAVKEVMKDDGGAATTPRSKKKAEPKKAEPKKPQGEAEATAEETTEAKSEA
ncbi:MAG: ribosomal protein [Streptosporangiaceae bacterium]|jgi:small subunit ribosomal protein S16|nr:ribosomal protein [Streptosporangiaceae bacterium]